MNTEIEPFAPVWSGYLADPFVWKTGDMYYAIGTGAQEAVGIAEGAAADGIAVPLLRSPNLRDWEWVHRALIHPGLEYGPEVWAPSVAERGGRFYMYYSIGECATRQNHHLRVAVADTPEGPYADTGTPLLVPDSDEVFVFDTHPFRDTDGQWYLFYNRNYFTPDAEGGAKAEDAIVVRRLVSMTEVGKEWYPVTRPFADWHRGPQRNYGGAVLDWHTNEGGAIILHNDKYFCFYSGSAWNTDKYGVDYVVADNVLGPYLSDNPTETPRILQGKPGILRGPGHNSLINGPDGADYIVFHAWDEAMENRQMYIEPLAWTADGPRLARHQAG